MNRKEWYRLRRLYRIKRLMYNAAGEEYSSSVYEAFANFPNEAIKRSVGYRDSTYGYNIPEMFSLIKRVRKTYPDKMDKYLGTLRGAMKANYNMAHITRCSCTPFDYFRGD